MDKQKGVKKKLKGIYLVPDPKMLKPNFGPSEHIKVGLRELKKYFDIELLVFGDFENFSSSETNTDVKSSKPLGVNSGLLGVLRDLKLFYYSNRNKNSLTQKINDMNVFVPKMDFIISSNGKKQMVSF